MATSGTGDRRLPEPPRVDEVSCLEQNGILHESDSTENGDNSDSDQSGEHSSEGSETSENESDAEETDAQIEIPTGELENTSAEESSSRAAEEPSKTTQLTESAGQTLCERCKNKHCFQSQKEKATPRKIASGEFLLMLNDEGIFQCTETGLIFEVSKKVHIKYCVLSWSKFAKYVKKPWTVGGPIFDVKCETSILKSIQFPHSICLADQQQDVTFKVLHIHGTESEIEPSIDHTTTHVKWRVSSLSPVGPLVKPAETVHHHGVVILYKVIDSHPSLSFRLYLAINNDSFIKDISKEVKVSGKKFRKIDKPPVCLKLLQYGMKYKLMSSPEAEINPQDFQFHDDSVAKLKNYCEVYFEEPIEFKLSLIEAESEEVVWTAKLRACDWTLPEKTTDARTSSTNCIKRRKSSIISEDEIIKKRLKLNSDTVTDQQLMAIAKSFGNNWKELGVLCLNLDMKDIDDIAAKDKEITIQKFRMLTKWREREQSRATVENLHEVLRSQEDVEYEVLKVLEGMLHPM